MSQTTEGEDEVPVIILRERNTARLTAVNIEAIATVAAEYSDNDAAVKADSPVYLSVRFVGDNQLTRYVPVSDEGREDVAVDEPDAAVRAFARAANYLSVIASG